MNNTLLANMNSLVISLIEHNNSSINITKLVMTNMILANMNPDPDQLSARPLPGARGTPAVPPRRVAKLAGADVRRGRGDGRAVAALATVVELTGELTVVPGNITVIM